MKLLILELGDDMRIDGQAADEAQWVEIISTLRYAFLREKHVDYVNGSYRLVFDLDEKQQYPNFVNPFEYV